jgi:hypothetical protein
VLYFRYLCYRDFVKTGFWGLHTVLIVTQQHANRQTDRLAVRAAVSTRVLLFVTNSQTGHKLIASIVISDSVRKKKCNFTIEQAMKAREGEDVQL